MFFLLWLPPSSLLSHLQCPRPRPPSLQRHFFCIISFSSYSLTEVSDLLGSSLGIKGGCTETYTKRDRAAEEKGKEQRGEPVEFRELFWDFGAPGVSGAVGHTHRPSVDMLLVVATALAWSLTFLLCIWADG